MTATIHKIKPVATIRLVRFMLFPVIIVSRSKRERRISASDSGGGRPARGSQKSVWF